MWKAIHLTLRFLLELVALAAVGYWGFQTGENVVVQWLLGIGTPLLIAVIWGMFIAPRARFHLHPLVKEALALIVFGSATLALIVVGQSTLGIVFMAVALFNSVVLYLTRHEPMPKAFAGK